MSSCFPIDPECSDVIHNLSNMYLVSSFFSVLFSVLPLYEKASQSDGSTTSVKTYWLEAAAAVAAAALL